MENRTLTKKTVAISFAVMFLLRNVLSFVSNIIAMSSFDGFYDTTSEAHLASYHGFALTSIGNLIVNIITIVIIIIAGRKITGTKTGTIRFLGCFCFGSAVETLFYSFINNMFQYYIVTFGVSSSDASTIINIYSVLCLIPAIFAAHIAFTALDGTNNKIPSHTLNVSLSEARKTFIITFIISAVVSGIVGSLPNLLLALIKPDHDTFILDALIFSGYLVKWLTNLIPFAIIYIAGYKTTKSHFGAISFYIPASALSIPVTSIIGHILSIATNFLMYFNQLQFIEAANDELSASITSDYSIACTIISSAGTVISVVASFIICYIAFSMFYTNKAEHSSTEQ